MTDDRTDQIAREAARLLERGQAGSIGEAVRAAAEQLGFRDAELPGHGRVRKHAGAMALQALGDVGYGERVREVQQVAERLMTVFTEVLPDARTFFVGRAARGLIDGGVTVHIRLYTRNSITELAGTLVDYGYDEPSFETVNTRHGRLNRLRLNDDGIEVVVTRLLPEMAADADRDLFSGRPIATATLEQLRKTLQA
ncbi:MAG: hypothetical protein ACYS0D_03355 [Planctomycetota bacterium]|jgi:hypothetical protein